ncbi:MAG: type II secretion system protein [Bacilli bacterium]|nr:type II secretion system protein [Bacilli bacterium]
MKNKGFTLVELLTVIVVLSLLAAIAIPSTIAINSRIKEKLLEEKITFAEKSAILWAQDNKECFTIDDCPYLESEEILFKSSTVSKTASFNLEFLVIEKYYEYDEDTKIINPFETDKCLNNYMVKVKYDKKSKMFTSDISLDNQESTCP